MCIRDSSKTSIRYFFLKTEKTDNVVKYIEASLMNYIITKQVIIYFEIENIWKSMLMYL